MKNLTIQVTNKVIKHVNHNLTFGWLDTANKLIQNWLDVYDPTKDDIIQFKKRIHLDRLRELTAEAERMHNARL